MSKVELRNIQKSFGDVQVINEFNSTFEDGEFVTLLGPSGCGKTTLLRMIAGFEKPTSGEIIIDGDIVSSEDCFVPPEKRKIGMVFQSYAVWPHMNVYNNIAYPLKIKKVPKKEIRNKVEKILDIVHLSQYKDRMPSQLSGGQQQRIALGRALIAEPKLLLLDEPLSNLDAKLRDSMRYEIKRISKELNITVIFVTHDQTEAMTMSDKVIILNKGIVQQSGSPFEIYHRPDNQFVADFIGKVNLIKVEKKQGKTYLLGSYIDVDFDVEYDRAVVGIRPENIILDDNGVIDATIEDMYFLGENTDMFLKFDNGEVVRCMAESEAYDKYKQGDKVKVRIKSYIAYPDDGEEHLKILT